MASHADPEALRTLHLVRHAHAGDADRWRGSDASRPLTEQGHDQARRLGIFLAWADVIPDRIITSPKVRAHETALDIAAAVGTPVTLDARLADGPTLQELAVLLADTGGRAPLIVGHDPGLSLLMDALTGAVGQEMRKGTIASFRVRQPIQPGMATLRWLIPPELVPPIGRPRTR